MSNALLVTGKESATGKPLAVMGPQTGYYAPQLLVEQVLNGPGIQARGVAFAGTNLFVQLGRGVDYAWSATSAGSDNIDTVVEKLCNTDGSKATVSSTGYLVGQELRADGRRRCTARPPRRTSPRRPPPRRTSSRCCAPGTASSSSAPRSAASRWRWCPSGRRTATRSTRCSASASSTTPASCTTPKSFQKAASQHRLHVQLVLRRRQGHLLLLLRAAAEASKKVEPDLPHWAGKKYDWKGWLSFKRHARETNPKRGYLVSWNNKPAPDFSAADDNWSYGAVYRSLALEKRLVAKIKGKKRIDLPGMVGVMAGGATADSRAAYTLKWLLKVIGKDKKTADRPRPAHAVAQGRRDARRPRPGRRL